MMSTHNLTIIIIVVIVIVIIVVIFVVVVVVIIVIITLSSFENQPNPYDKHTKVDNHLQVDGRQG